MNDTYIVLLIILLILFFLVFNSFTDIESFTNITTSTAKNNEIVQVKRPFVNLYDNNGQKLNVILVSKPFSNDTELKIYEDNKDKCIFIGITSYLEFPNMPSNPFENFNENYKKYKYLEICEGWIYGFKNPEKYFPPDIPLHFASESDWIDCNLCKPDKTIKKKYDFIYICLKVDEKKELCDDWATYNKNWALAKKCLDIFCNKYKLKGLLVGRKGCELPPGCKYMETTNMLDYNDLKKKYNESRFIFLPNEKDASPRVLAEAMATDIPCLVNNNILGGWKYVNDKTGEFFTDEKDISASLDILLNKMNNNEYTPRGYFIKHYSVEKSGKKLKEFLYKHWKDRLNLPEEQVAYISPEFIKKNFETCKSIIK